MNIPNTMRQSGIQTLLRIYETNKNNFVLYARGLGNSKKFESTWDNLPFTSPPMFITGLPIDVPLGTVKRTYPKLDVYFNSYNKEFKDIIIPISTSSYEAINEISNKHNILFNKFIKNDNLPDDDKQEFINIWNNTYIDVIVDGKQEKCKLDLTADEYLKYKDKLLVFTDSDYLPFVRITS